MERPNARDPIAERIDSIRMSANEREHAKTMMRRAERFADFLADAAAAWRSLAAQARRSARRHFGARKAPATQ
jgi:hypothetical protein